MNKNTMWLLISDLKNPFIHLIIPSLAWLTDEADVEFECYLESERNGQLFARTGSTVLGGHHHQQFNYLNSIYDIKYIIFGESTVFRSSITAFDSEILIETNSLAELYSVIKSRAGIEKNDIIFTGDSFINIDGNTLELGPYLFPEIYYRKALAYPFDGMDNQLKENDQENKYYIFLNDDQRQKLLNTYPDVKEIDRIKNDDSYGSITLRIADRWKDKADGLAFGDPAAILSQLATLCLESRIAVYGKKVKKAQSEVEVSDYTEDKTEIADEIIQLAEEIDNPVLVGRQTGDGDLFAWSKAGICLQIMDPNRPPFPIVKNIDHHWLKTGSTLYEQEPSDEDLERYAEEGKILTTLIWHSGEMAHNEAMLNLFELSCITGLKMGIGVHAARYQTCPQLWELMNIPQERGGVKGLIEPVLHSGGLGVMAEINCPPDKLKKHCQSALKQIKKITGEEGLPRGYYAFMDADMCSLEPGNDKMYEAIEDSGLEYIISSAQPGRNRIIKKTDNSIIVNQTCRSIASASPFIRFTTVEELKENTPAIRPGWIIGTLDAPVIAFNPYIWRHGSRFMKILDWIQSKEHIINVTPNVIARYARILQEKNYLP